MPIPVEYVNGKKHFTVLENNPEVFTPLARKLGISPTLKFIDIYSLDPDYLSSIQRPILALLVIIPLTPTWHAERQSQDTSKPLYSGFGPDEEILWFKQTIGHACGSIGLLHCLLNGPARGYILPGSNLERLREAAVPRQMEERALLLYESKELEDAHQSVAELGDTAAPGAEAGDRLGQHFVAFVKDEGKVWELEGSRKGPICRGELGKGEDLLSERGVQLSIGRVIELERAGGGKDLRFSVLALVKAEGNN